MANESEPPWMLASARVFSVYSMTRTSNEIVLVIGERAVILHNVSQGTIEAAEQAGKAGLPVPLFLSGIRARLWNEEVDYFKVCKAKIDGNEVTVEYPGSIRFSPYANLFP